MVMHVCSMAHLFVARTTIFGIEFIMEVAGWEKKKNSHYMVSNRVSKSIVSRSKVGKAAFHHLKGKLSKAQVHVCGKKKKKAKREEEKKIRGQTS